MTWTSLTYIVFEVCGVGRGNIAICKLLAIVFFCNLHTTYSEMTCPKYLGGDGGASKESRSVVHFQRAEKVRYGR